MKVESNILLTCQRPMSLLYRNQSVNFLSKSTDWFLCMGTLFVKRLKVKGSYESFKERSKQLKLSTQFKTLKPFKHQPNKIFKTLRDYEGSLL